MLVDDCSHALSSMLLVMVILMSRVLAGSEFYTYEPLSTRE